MLVPSFAKVALNPAAEEFPRLDASRYAKPALSGDELNRQYALTVLRALDVSPVVKALSEATSLLSEGEISAFEVDWEAGLDAAVAVARAEIARKGKQQVLSDAEGPEDQEGPEVPEQEEGPRPIDVDVGAKDVEISNLRNLARNLEAEWNFKYDDLQMRYDELLARFMRQQDKLGALRADVKKVREEHGEYEDIIHRCKGLTISETEARVDDLCAQVEDCEERHGKESREYSDLVSILRSTMKVYHLVQKRRPEVQRFLRSVPVPCMSYNSPVSASAGGSHDYEHFERQLSTVGRGGITRGRQVARRGQSNRGRGGRGRGTVAKLPARGRSVRGSASTNRCNGSLNIDQLLNYGPESEPHPFELKWLHCSEGDRSQASP